MDEREFTEKIMELIQDFYGDEIDITTFKDSGILTKDEGLEVTFPENNQTFYITIQKK